MEQQTANESKLESLTEEQRAAVLDKEVQALVAQGFRVSEQTALMARLTRPKRFSPLWAFLGLLALGIGLLAYLLYYVQKSDEVVILRVDIHGQVTRSKPQHVQPTTWTSDPGH
jgi:hypothetical protein